MEFKRLPNHIAIIMDGNGRWAQRRGRPRVYGHVRGSTRVRDLIREAHRIGLKALTLYAFSSENWGRPADEISVLMRLLPKWLLRERSEMMKNNIRFRTVGNIEQLPAGVIKIIRETLELSKNNTGMQFTLALSYGSRQEITSAVKRIAMQVSEGALKPENIDEDMISSELFDSELGDPDLLIRTSGEHRISNFMLWQIAYSEFFFTEVCWPDFTIDIFHEALKNFESRERRFGLTGGQIKKMPNNKEYAADYRKTIQ